MNKRSAFLTLAAFPSFVILGLLVIQALLFLFEENYSGSPAYFSVYRESGYYEIDPETTLGTLNRGETNVLVPFFGNPDREEPYYDSVAWTQSDYLKIANALSLETWNEPLDWRSWRVIDMNLTRSCENNPLGFDTFTITYYRELGVKNWERQYITRLIEIYAWQGLVHWGSGAVFSAPLLLGWDGVDITQFSITSDQALQIAERNGGSGVRRTVGNTCRIFLTANHLSPFPDRDDWLVDYDRALFSMYVNPYTGKHRILK